MNEARPESLLEAIPHDGRKLKILISLLYYFPHRTGLTIHVQRVAEELVRRGHQVTVLTARYRSDLPRDDVSMHEGVRIVRLWAPIRLSRGFIMPAYPLAAYKLMLEHDVVSIHTPMLETALTALLAKLTRRKIVITHHGDLVLPKGSPVNAFIQSTMFLMYRLAAHWSPQLIAYSQDYAEHSYYVRPYLHKTAVNYPPIVMPLPNPQRVEELRHEWSRDGGPVIGFAGRFVEEKTARPADQGAGSDQRAVPQRAGGVLRRIRDQVRGYVGTTSGLGDPIPRSARVPRSARRSAGHGRFLCRVRRAGAHQ